jgi:hypothetical protein
MNRNQVENLAQQSSSTVDINLDEFLDKPVGKAPQMVNLNGEVSPAVLAGILGVNVSMIYTYRQEGKLPPNSDATLRECIKYHLTWWQNKSANKATGLSEAVQLQKIQLDRARTEAQWLAIKKERGELVDIGLLAETFEPHFLQMRAQLASISRKHPELQKELDTLQKSWVKLGLDMRVQASEELEDFIQKEMDREIEISDEDTTEEGEDDESLSSFY